MSAKIKIFLKEWVIPYATVAVVTLLLAKFVFFLLIIPTGSMIPTIDEGSFLFALRVHNPDELERGDIVVFDSTEIGKKLAKRLIGLPGETVVIDDSGVVFINGEALDEPYVKNHSLVSGEFSVPEGCFFFLGDNRSSSFDARAWNQPYISGDKIDGKAVFTIFPFNNFGVIE